MWHQTFAARLESWTALRTLAQDQDLETALAAINAWWSNSPWKAYYLHWDDYAHWPDPWQLLSDNIYCELARGLGILYTITLLDRADLAPVELVLTAESGNLVLATPEKYILNWASDTIVNTNLDTKILKQYTAPPIQ